MRKYVCQKNPAVCCDSALCDIHYLRTAAMSASSYVENMAMQLSSKPGAKSYDEWLTQVNASYGLDKGISAGFFTWLGDAVRGQFGDSWKYTVPVTQKFSETIWLSFVMGLISFVLELVIAIPLASSPQRSSIPERILPLRPFRSSAFRCLPSSLPPCSSCSFPSSWGGLTSTVW